MQRANTNNKGGMLAIINEDIKLLKNNSESDEIFGNYKGTLQEKLLFMVVNRNIDILR